AHPLTEVGDHSELLLPRVDGIAMLKQLPREPIQVAAQGTDAKAPADGLVAEVVVHGVSSSCRSGSRRRHRNYAERSWRRTEKFGLRDAMERGDPQSRRHNQELGIIRGRSRSGSGETIVNAGTTG